MTTPRRKYISLRQAAEILGYSPRQVRRWIDEGKIPGYRPPGRETGTSIRLDEEEVLAFLRRIPSA